MTDKRVLVINGSYRDDGVTEQIIDCVTETLATSGAALEVVALREHPIEFCLNCRECMQVSGAAPGACVIDDDMATLIDEIERADAYVLASPTNLGSVTAVFKRFMERLAPYGYWPWGARCPRLRKADGPRKQALLISSSAAPAWLGRWMFHSRGQLAMTARTLGADCVGTLFTGQAASSPHFHLSDRGKTRARALAARLL